MKFSIQSEHDLEPVVEAIYDLQAKGLYLFYGNLGAGKTTLIKYLLQYKNIVEDVSSPTYNILHKYHTKTGETVLHADFYRLASEHDILELGWFDEYGLANYIFVEWPEQLIGLIEEPYLKIDINLDSATSVRTISLSLISV